MKGLTAMDEQVCAQVAGTDPVGFDGFFFFLALVGATKRAKKDTARKAIKLEVFMVDFCLNKRTASNSKQEATAASVRCQPDPIQKPITN
jgi:hypothetical protein